MDEVFPLEDGVGLNVVRSGAPDAPVTVVLAHGYALDHRSWHRVIPELAHDELQVVAYDHRGHGQSGPATPETASIEQLGDDLAELIDRGVDSERVVVVGHSMGGMATMALVERHPRLFSQRVSGLAFLSTAVGRRGETSLAWPQAVGKLVEELEKVFGPVVRHIRGRIEPAKAAGLKWWLFGDDPNEEDAALTAEMVAEHWPATVALFRPAFDRYDREAALTVASRVPVVAAVGERDRLCPASNAQGLVKAVGSGDAVVLPGAGHMVPLERPAEVVRLVRGLVVT
ncbi:alpha/beta fold hydrolase [Kutzneria kofuensis]|uniref:Pimeloyl-ACP methyl ester carboxylesterase n=1 Tax=Kutzneria kofuensis TaxID=103725 RepID=A0A7W9KTS6_9PSEU|nr:alpha/beta hydrolase [Kutzneria kofuensis]MBB5897829.1 pimeloyl-ACP methyl ester carboxylesterase [Kutzneria kofuensis]